MQNRAGLDKRFKRRGENFSDFVTKSHKENSFVTNCDKGGVEGGGGGGWQNLFRS